MTYVDVTFDEFKQILDEQTKRLRIRAAIGHLIIIALFFIFFFLFRGWVRWLVFSIVSLLTLVVVHFAPERKEVFFRITLPGGKTEITQYFLLK